MNPNRSLVVILLLACAPLARGAEWYVNYRDGLDAVRAQKWSEAISYFTEAINERPDERAKARTVGVQFIDYFPYVYRGLAYYKSGNNDRALADFERSERARAVFDGSSDTEAQRILREYLGRLRSAPVGEKAFMEGRDLFRQREFAKAIEKFRTVPANSAYRREAQQYIDLAQAEMQKDQVASKPDERPAPNKPSVSSDRIELEFQAGVRLFDKQDYVAAENRFKSVLQKSPDHAGAQRYLNLAKSMRAGMASAPRRGSGGRSSRPEDSAPRGTDAGPDDNNALYAQATQLFGEGKLESARRLFLTVRSADPSHGQAAAYLDSIARTQEVIRGGIVSFFEGDYRSAIRQLGDASRLTTDNVSLYGVLAAAYASQYFLGGGEERDLQRNAVEAFRRARQIDANYTLDGRFFSPRIAALLNNQ